MGHLVVKKFLATLIVGALGLTACGGSAVKTDSSKPATPKPVDAAALTKASAATTDANSARLLMKMTATDFDDGGDGGVSIAGVVDFETGDADLLVTGEGGVGEGLDQPLQILVVDKVPYLKVSDATRDRLDIPTPWVKATAEQIGFKTGDDPLSGLTNFLEPAEILKSLEAVRSGVTATENVERNGVDTTHYEVELKFSELMKEAANATNDPAAVLAQGFLGMFAGLVVPIDVWVDEEGRVVEFELRMDLSSLVNAFESLDESTSTTLSTQKPTMTINLKLSDYGTDVKVELPPASEISELPEGTKLFENEAGISDDDDDENDEPSCAKQKMDAVNTAIEALRAMTGDSDAEPALQDLVDEGLLREGPEDVTLTWDGGKSLTASC